MHLNLLGQRAGVSSPIYALAVSQLRLLALEAPREPLCRVLQLSGSPKHDGQPEPSLRSGVKNLLSFALCIHQGFFPITVTLFGDPVGSLDRNPLDIPRLRRCDPCLRILANPPEGVLALLGVATRRVLAKTYWRHRSAGWINQI